ncbi:NADH:ubiquinone oxidoreductase [Halopseudomonas maritima]|uniref:NADH:ubiquinone oxidoreductase n=1 Tax=Halopseudomonas maritima TaxID=2918528 RepID=UPI001EEA9F42|nr:NADH:ubiquinone oxidoreductase [Halopseudomonas maritima]UJJ33210.1 NADH:ubiquinone oxidoreductase [Halopseudomonas maritima]
MTRLLLLALSLSSQTVLAGACLIESTDDQLPIRLCQTNRSIPDRLFEQQFCQPQIPDRSFSVTLLDACPTGAYGICVGAHTEGVSYQQDIHYYSDADDTPVLQAYCERISQGQWQTP